MSRMLTTREVAERLNLAPVTVSRHARRIPGAHKLFGRWRFDADTFEAWLAASQEQADPWALPERRRVP